MIAYLNGVIKLIDNKSFVGKEGDKIEFNTVYLQCEEEDGSKSTAQLNTKKDLSKWVDEEVTVKLVLNKDKEHSSLYRASIADVTALNEQ